MTDQAQSEPAGQAGGASERPTPPPPPPPPAIGATEAPVPVPSPEPDESASTLASPASSWRPEEEPSGPAALAAERPEIAAGAAFAGGLVLALILKRLAR